MPTLPDMCPNRSLVSDDKEGQPTHPDRVTSIRCTFMDGVVVTRIISPVFILFVRILRVSAERDSHCRRTYLEGMKESGIKDFLLLFRRSGEFDPIELLSPRRTSVPRCFFEGLAIRNLFFQVLSSLVHRDERNRDSHVDLGERWLKRSICRQHGTSTAPLIQGHASILCDAP